jgi:hypothetical protein
MSKKHFPDCEIYHGEQRTPEWHALRAGQITASTAGEWLLEGCKVRTTIDEAKTYLDSQGVEYKKAGNRDYFLSLLPPEMLVPTYSKEAEGAKETAICEIMEGMVIDETAPTWGGDKWMQRGVELEPVALDAFATFYGCQVEQVSFCQSLHGSFGCSPDGLVKGAPEGVEVKVLKGATHLKYLRAGILPREYRIQVLFSLAVTGATAWHFWAWSPVVPPLHILVQRDDTVERLKQSLIDFSADLEAAKIDMGQRWENWSK